MCREEFRKDYKEKHPNVKQVSVVSVVFSADSSFVLKICDGFVVNSLFLMPCLCESQIGKAGGDKWKSLSDAVSVCFLVVPLNCSNFGFKFRRALRCAAILDL